MKTDSTKAKYAEILDIHNQIVKESGKYAPYLASSYFIDNTIIVAASRGLQLSRSVTYEALRHEKELSKIKQYLMLK